jgi:hypothetical protein
MITRVRLEPQKPLLKSSDEIRPLGADDVANAGHRSLPWRPQEPAAFQGEDDLDEFDEDDFDDDFDDDFEEDFDDDLDEEFDDDLDEGEGTDDADLIEEVADDEEFADDGEAPPAVAKPEEEDTAEDE